MNKMIFAIIMLFALLFAGCAGNSPPGGQVACTQEAKMCPDGSAVGRTGPNCEFAPCPGEGNASGCGTCPMLSQPAPGFCSHGTIVSGPVDECGCRGPPTCACTEEAKVCPDGSSVGRIGANCEFAPCPKTVGGNGSGTSGNASEDFLLSHKWKLLKIDNETLVNSPVEIQFGMGRFNGNAGCNSMGGGYLMDEDQISFGQTAITLMYCEGRMDLEGKVLEKINGGPYRWEIVDEKLNFYKGDALVMVWGVETE